MVIVLVIAASALLAGLAAVRRLAEPQPVDHLWAVAAAGVLGFLGNEIVARYRIRTGRRIGSAALVADGLHARTDGFTSLAVVLGAAGVAAGWPLADPIVGLLITVAILVVLRDAAREVYRRLMDAVDPALLGRAEAALGEVPDVIERRPAAAALDRTPAARRGRPRRAGRAQPRPRPRGGRSCGTAPPGRDSAGDPGDPAPRPRASGRAKAPLGSHPTGRR